MNRKVAYGGVSTAIAVILLGLSTYLPTGKAATLFLASLTVYIVCLFFDKKTGVIVYLASSVLAFFVSSAGAVGIVALYAVCFGNYPVFKCMLDRVRCGVRISVKIVLYTIYCLVVYAGILLLAGIKFSNYLIPLLYIAGVFCFWFYDYLLANTGRYAVNILNKRF